MHVIYFARGLLYIFITIFISFSLPMYKYYVAHVQRHVSSGNLSFGKEISYTKFRLSVIAMIRYVFCNCNIIVTLGIHL